MTRAILAAALLVACGREASPPSAPVIDVPPMPPASAAPGPQMQDPPPNPDPPYPNQPAASAEPPPIPAPAPASSTLYPPHGNATQPFDKGAAAHALGSVSVQRCKLPGGPTGAGHVTITFDPSGRVSVSVVDQGPFPGTPTGGCIAQTFGTVKVPPFAGPPVRVGKSFLLN